VGTTTPAAKLEIVSGTGTSFVGTFRTGDATAANNAGGGFWCTSSATAGSRDASLWLDADGANFGGGDYFWLQKLGNNGVVNLIQASSAAMTFQTAATERMRITSAGDVGIGNSAPGAKLEVTGVIRSLRSGSTSAVLQVINDNNSWNITCGTTTQVFAVDNNLVGRSFYVNPDNNFVVNQNIGIGNTTPTTSGTGITFPATQNASSNANTLDDYEEGSFTPSWSSTGASFSYDGNYRHGQYTKIGNRVYFSIYISTSGAPTGTTSNILAISGFPFVSAAVSNASTCASSFGQLWNVDWPVNKNLPTAYVPTNATTMTLNWEQDGTTSSSWAASALLASCYVIITGFYETT
jgi:hypothetical protein